LTERRLASEIRSRTCEFVEGGGAGVYGTGKGWLRHGLDIRVKKLLFGEEAVKKGYGKDDKRSTERISIQLI